MKHRNKLIALGLLLCLLLSLAPMAAAEENADDPDARFEGKTWNEATEEFIEARHTNEKRVAIGYCNTVTGEEYYYRGDEFMISGSLYKVPLNMVFTERIANGEMDWDTKINLVPYEKLLEWTIVNSDNQMAEYLWRNIGTYRKYREVIAPYMGEDPETADWMYYKNNYFTPREMIHCLKLLYDNPDRFPRVIDTMKKAEPKNYFNYHAQPVEIAHKYGYLPDENWGLILNDSGVIYTEDPFCLVVFTAGIMQPYEFLSDYCTLMIDYTNYHTQRRHEEELQKSREAAILALTTTPEPTEQPQESTSSADGSATVTGTAAVVQTLTGENPSAGTGQKPVFTVLILALAAAALIALIRPARNRQLKYGWAALGVACAALSLLLCVFAPGIKPTIKVADPEGDPRDSDSAFLDALVEGDYPEAYAYLYDYASLGLEKDPEGEGARLMAQALRNSYGYELFGECELDGQSARQQVLLDVLDLTAIQADLKTATEAEVARMNEELSEKELLDDNGQFRKEITDAAYLKALQEVLAYPDRYKTSVGVELELIYTQDGWKVQTNNQLLYALSGKTAYGK